MTCNGYRSGIILYKIDGKAHIRNMVGLTEEDFNIDVERIKGKKGSHIFYSEFDPLRKKFDISIESNEDNSLDGKPLKEVKNRVNSLLRKFGGKLLR
ncbi:hypothetical protein CMI40_00405 [Candidatus Pacearchaeota archaeon]|jgi:hypothetical protein|nr:hypothetical protein [Candidatus Pacearchaeota archaeon]|tara:strand:- start:4314 stop:4604 length:291 start_codon:yes stop_codon:yes gene_type:complete